LKTHFFIDELFLTFQLCAYPIESFVKFGLFTDKRHKGEVRNVILNYMKELFQDEIIEC
jgi:hypothetical protein